jgi:hypothetical protein
VGLKVGVCTALVFENYMKGYFFPFLLSLLLFAMGILYLSIFHHHIVFNDQNPTAASSNKEIILQRPSHRHIIPLPSSFSSSSSISDSILSSQSSSEGIKNNVKSLSSSSSSPYAYITLLHGIDESFKYRGYLYNIMIMKTALQSLGSTADFLVMIGYTYDKNTEIFQSDLDRLTSIGIKLIILPRYLSTDKVNFAEMALLKITPWSLTQYQKIQFFDGDIMPIMNMDCYFQLQQNTFNVGNASPLNSGWFLAIPNLEDFEALKAKALKRLNEPWDRTQGWGEPVPSWLGNSKGKAFPDWNFNGASLDQGLLTHYFVINQGRVVLINHKIMTRYDGISKPPVTVSNLLSSCQSRIPTSAFAHFTGKSKPWLSPITARSRGDVKIWGKYLDQLRIDGVNSSNIHEQGLKPPLGYFHPNT